MTNPTERFSSRVENYIRYRPGYPAAVLALLRDECGLTPASVIADIGSGTGLLAELFLRNDNAVFGVEPNGAMRAAGERLLASYPHFTSIAATAEATTLPDQSVNFVTAGQAFHWFDRDQTRAEFARILRPGGWVALVWNTRRIDTPFLAAYDQLMLVHSNDYSAINHTQVDRAILDPFFHPAPLHLATFPNVQRFDWDGLRGRTLSSSYIPESGPAHETLLKELEALFQLHQKAGLVGFEYRTMVYYGQLSPSGAT